METYKVLIIEDDDLYSKTIEMMLGECGNFTITSVITLYASIEEVKKEVFDFILCDLGLPDSSGAHTVKEIRKYTKVPLIILSGSDIPSVIAATLSSGAECYILKSEATIDKLKGVIDFILHKR